MQSNKAKHTKQYAGTSCMEFQEPLRAKRQRQTDSNSTIT